MEHYIIIIMDVSDITYKSELIPPAFLQNARGGINSPKQLTFTLFRKLWAH